MIVKNQTHYFSEYTKLFNAFPDPDSFSMESSKRMGYFQRLWFEYAYTRKVKGLAFYYTLTYNDFHIPKFYGKNCFSYKDIRYITNGKLSKILLRKYGSKLKYFCACEKGEGKGNRGLGNNPHYHFIFFVQPAGDERYPYIQISAQEFKDIIYELWQGYPSSRYVDWRFAKYGHCQEGQNNGEILSAEAFSYVGKYCVKDSEDRLREHELSNIFRAEIIHADICNEVLYEYYKFLKSTELGFDKYQFFKHFRLHEYNHFRKSSPTLVDTSLERYYFDYCGVYGQMLIYDITGWYKDYFVDYYVEQRMSEYRNLYSGKCRMSKSLGEYGLNFISYVDGSPRLVLNTKQGYVVQYPCLYYIRKLFYDVKLCPVTGNPLYYLNDLGRQMKLQSLKSTVDSFIKRVHENISYCAMNDFVISKSESDLRYHDYLIDKSLYYPDGSKYIDYEVSEPKNDVLIELCFRSDFHSIVRKYAIFHYVYQYRSYFESFGLSIGVDSLDVAYLHDYEVFLRHNSYFLDYETGTVYDMVYRSPGIKSFRNHPEFKPYIEYFEFLDKMMTQVDLVLSDKDKEKFKAKSEHQKRVNAFKFNSSISFEQIVLCDDVSSAILDSPKVFAPSLI